MSGSKPGPPPTTLYRYPQSITDAELLRLLRAQHAQNGGSFAKTVERILAEALMPHKTAGSGAQEELPLGHDTTMAA